MQQNGPLPSLGPLKGSFCLEPEEVQLLLEELDATVDTLLQKLITPASSLARPPISSYHVGAVGLAASGRIYAGCNLEFPRLPLHQSVHAEQFLLVNALQHGERAMAQIAVSAAPCGHCRQFLCELACADTVELVFGGGRYHLEDILPHRFGPSDLLEDASVPLLLAPQTHDVRFSPDAEEQLDRRKHEVAFQKAARQALRAAQKSYAPYSMCAAGLALVTSGGKIHSKLAGFSGGYIESAAFNPSLPPLQAAVIDAIIHGLPCYSQIVEAVLVERAAAIVSHAAATRTALQQIASAARLTVLTAQPPPAPASAHLQDRARGAPSAAES